MVSFIDLIPSLLNMRNNFYRKDTSSRAAAEFWEKKNDWLPGWNLGANDDSHLQVDFVRVWAL